MKDKPAETSQFDLHTKYENNPKDPPRPGQPGAGTEMLCQNECIQKLGVSMALNEGRRYASTLRCVDVPKGWMLTRYTFKGIITNLVST